MSKKNPAADAADMMSAHSDRTTRPASPSFTVKGLTKLIVKTATAITTSPDASKLEKGIAKDVLAFFGVEDDR